MKKIVPSLLGLMLAVGVILPMQAAHAEEVSSKTAPEKFQQVVDNAQAKVQERIDELKEQKEAGTNIQERLDVSQQALLDADIVILVAQEDVLYLYIAGPQEKRALRISLMALGGMVRERYETVKDVNERLDAGEITNDVAEDELEAALTQSISDLEKYKGEFKASVHEFMQQKAVAAKTYLNDGLDFGDMIADSYTNLTYEDENGVVKEFNTKRVKELLANSRARYEEGEALYKQSNEAGDEDSVENMQKAMIKFIRSRQLLTKAQGHLKVMDSKWFLTYQAEDCVEDTTTEATECTTSDDNATE